MLLNDGRGNFTYKEIERFKSQDRGMTFAVCSLQNRYVVVVSGGVAWNKTKSVERYDMQRDIWEDLASIEYPDHNSDLCCVSLDDSVYVYNRHIWTIEKLSKATGPIE